MTRETKVGLLVGLVVILLIGIIVSDTLSVARTQTPATGMIDIANSTQQTLIPPGIADAAAESLTAQNINREGASSRLAPVPLPEESAPARLTIGAVAVEPATHVVIPPAAQHVRLETPAQPEPATLVHYVQRGETLYSLAQRYYGHGEQWRAIRDANARALDSSGQLRLGTRLMIPNRTSSGGLAAHPDFQSVGSDAPPAPAAAAPTIKVVAGDTLSSLAAKHLGSAQKWKELLEANRDKIRTPNDLRPDMVLRLPAGANRAPARETVHVLPGRGATASESRAVEGRLYVVQAGDTLYSIAQRQLGDQRLWQKLYEANRDTLRSESSLRIGQKLRLPERG